MFSKTEICTATPAKAGLHPRSESPHDPEPWVGKMSVSFPTGGSVGVVFSVEQYCSVYSLVECCTRGSIVQGRVPSVGARRLRWQSPPLGASETESAGW